MNKTLSELLTANIYQKINVKIGSIKGNSFFYCGKGRDALSALSRSVDRIAKKRLKMETEHLEERLENLDKIYETRLKETIKRVNTSKSKRYVNIEKVKEDLEKSKARELKKLPKEIEIRKQELEVHLLDREVVEVIEGISPDEKPCRIIYIKGHEKGAYWTIDEYENKTGKYEDE